MDFRSDNVTGAAPEIMAALHKAANAGPLSSYGDDPITARVERRLCQLFEHEVAVFPVATGTAANALALSTLVPPWGVVYCHAESHIEVDECAAPEFFTGGAKLTLLAGEHGKLSAAALAERLPGGKGIVHHPQPAAVSLTQATEAGTVYTPDEIAAIGETARQHGLVLHIDGARFANALVTLGCRPADITWRAGADVLSLGATKNGALAAEAVVFFDKRWAADFGFRRKRAGHLFSKMRFLSAQLEAYLDDDLWLRNARQANGAATRLAAGLKDIPGVRLRHPVEANEVFLELAEPTIRALLADGFLFHRWDGDSGRCIRLVTAFDTPVSAVDAFLAALRRHAAE